MEQQTKQPLFYDYEGLPPDPISIPCGDATTSSQGTKTITLGTFTLSQIEEAITNVVDHAFQIIGMVTTRTRPCLFDCASFSHHYTYWPDIKVEHDDTWDDIGRAYYESRDYQFSEFHCTLCSVDEMKQQIESWVRQYEQNRILSVPCFVMEESVPDFFERYFSQRHWNEDFHAWIGDFQSKYIVERKLWTADEHHFCRPYKDLLIYQHQLAKLSLSGTHPQARMAARPCCRSFLMASCRQSSGDDLLGH